MAARHPITFPVHLFRAFLLYEAFEPEVDGFATHLANEHEENFGFAVGPEECGVNKAEGLGDKGEPGAYVGEGVMRILFTGASAGLKGRKRERRSAGAYIIDVG